MRFIPSLRLIGALYATITTLIILAASGYVLVDLYRQSQNEGARRTERDLTQQQQHIAQLLQFYQGVAERLARDDKVTNLILFADHSGAQAWSASLRTILADVTGLALFTTDGNILGQAASQRVGPKYLADMRQLVAGSPAPRFPVHNEQAGLEHVDITAVVRHNDDTTGILFLSLALQRVQQVLGNTTVAGQSLVLRDAAGRTIAYIDKLNGETDVVRVQGPVPGTPWSLELTQHRLEAWPAFRTLIVATVVVVLAIIVLIQILARRTTRLFTGELNQLRAALQQVAEGAPLEPQREPRLREFQPIVPAIHTLAEQIQDTQKRLSELTVTDVLTQLPNRRRFDMELVSAFANAQRGHPAYLVLIDLDHFKAINDRYGHEGGDRVLCLLAETLRRECRGGDLVARLGGDEFAAIMLDTTGAGVLQWFERVRKQMGDNAEASPLSISVGFVALGSDRFGAASDAQRAADAALYQAKARGRDCAVEG